MTLDSVIPLCSLVNVSFCYLVWCWKWFVSVVWCISITGDLLVDEDVDIVGGNDPPLKIEKDVACTNSSSSSSSGSSSSSSGSCSCEPSSISFE